MNNREAFEAWYKNNFGEPDFLRGACGTYYMNSSVDFAWQTWQASLASQAQQYHSEDALNMVQSQAQQTENHKSKIKAWCNTLEKAADNFERQGYIGESSDLLDIKAYIQPIPPAPEGE